jgi:hypothetical protein
VEKERPMHVCIPFSPDHLEEVVRFYHFEPNPLERFGLEYVVLLPMPADRWRNFPPMEGEFDQGHGPFLVREGQESDSEGPLQISSGYAL